MRGVGGRFLTRLKSQETHTQNAGGPRTADSALRMLASPCELAAARHHHQLGFIVAFLSFVCLEYPVFPPFSGR